MKINNYLKKIKQFVGATLLLLSTASIAQPPPPPVEYCVPTFDSLCTSTNDYVNNFFTTGGLTNISNLESQCNGQANNYIYYGGQLLTANAGQTIDLSLQTGSPQWNQGIAVWIDYNQNGIFGDVPSELVYITPTTGNSSTIFTGSFTVPQDAVSGLTRMRVRNRFASLIIDPCANYVYGETEDYDVEIISEPCVAPPVAGTANSSESSLCSGINFDLSLSGNSFGSGMVFQWQSSLNNIDFTDIVGANATTYTTSQTATTYYRCSLTCSGQTAFSVSVMVTTENCFIMDGNPSTTCSGTFYDSGGLGNYSNTTNITQTFTPSTPGQMLQFDFTSFELEDIGFTGTIYDQLIIYNGPDINSPIIGSYYGTNSPGIVTASNPTGELTFQFISDISLTFAGWEATISCVAPVVNDAVVLYAYTLGKVPQGFGTPHQVVAYVKNNNSTLSLTFPVTLTVSGANAFTNTQTITLAAQEIGFVTFAGYNAASTGLQNLNISVAADEDNSNNTIEIDQEVSLNAFSYKYPSVSNEAIGVGFTGETGEFVSKFVTNQSGSINSVKVDFTVAGAEYQIGIWDATGLNGTPGTLLYSSPSATTNIGTDFITINPPVPVNGAFYVGVIQTTNTNVGFAYQIEEPLRAGTFMYSSPTGSNTWLDVKDIPASFRFAMEVEMALPIPPNCAVYSSPLDLAADICLNEGTISWASGGLAPTSYDVYFGTDPTLAGVTPVNVTTTNYNPGLLLANTTYYWKIVPLNQFGAATGCSTASFTTGTCITYLQSNNNITTCSANYFDSGNITGNYSSNENSTFTITPSTPGAFAQVDFTSFALENNFDFLKVFNGGSILSPQIGPANGYTGAIGPGIVTASNPTGQLTFQFLSDGSDVAAGWEAVISCITTPPTCATISTPIDGATDICLNSGAINWAQVGATLGYTVTFGTDPALVGATSTDVAINSFYPGTLLPNTTYYYSVVPFNNFGDAIGCGIQSYTTGTCNSCDYSIVMYDDFGDGWNGGTVNVFANGVEVAGSPFTLTTGTGPVTISFPVNEGEEITTQFNSGAFAIEVGYQILNSFGQIEYQDGFLNNVVPALGPNVVGNASCLPITNDASVDIVYTLGKLPVGFGTPHTVSARVTNNNTFDTATIPVTLNVSGANTFTLTENVTLIAGASATVNFPGFSPTVIGSNTITVSVPADQNTSNDSISVVQLTTENVYTYKLSDVLNEPFGVGFTGGTGDFVAKFNSNGANPINQVNVDFTAGGQTYSLGIWDATGPNGAPGALVSEVTGLTSAIGTAFITVDPPVTVTGDFYVGVRQIGTTNIAFAYQDETPIRPQTFYFTAPTGGTTWTDFAPDNSFRFAIEVEIDLGVSPNCATYISPIDAETGLCLNQVNLIWASGGLAPTSYDVYLSTDPTFAGATPFNTTALTYNPGILLPNTQYYWKVVPLNDNGAAIGCISQTFTTGDCLFYNQSNSTITTCSGSYYDAGGSTANYSNNENSTFTINPATPGNVIQVIFNSFSTENNYDGLMIYDGPDNTWPLISSGLPVGTNAATCPAGSWRGTGSPGIVTSSHPSGSLTFVFRSEGSGTSAGWDATINCVDLTAAPGCVSNTLPAEGSTNVNSNPTISWSQGAGTIPTGYNVYFGTQGNLTLVSPNQPETTFTPSGPLELNTTYCYQIIALNANGEATGCATNCFTTEDTLTILMQNVSVSTCNAIFTDSNGPSANYSNNENYTLTINPAVPGNFVAVNFTDFATELGYDGLLIYDGPDNTFPLIPSGLAAGANAATAPANSWRGTNSPGIIVASNPSGALTFVFTSDVSGTPSGWIAEVSCIDPTSLPVCVTNVSPADGSVSVDVNPTITWSPGIGTIPTGYNVFFGTQGNLTLVSSNQDTASYTPSSQLELNTVYCYQIVAVNANGEATGCATNCFTTNEFMVYTIDQAPEIVACSGIWTDAGGPNSNYSNDENYTQTLTPSTPNSFMQVTFNSFETEEDYDGLLIYDGPDNTWPLIPSGLAVGANAVTAPANSWYGTTSPGVITSTHPSGSLTFAFRSDVSGTPAGWNANLACVPQGDPCLDPLEILYSGNTDVCVGTSVTLNSSTPLGNSWSTNGSVESSITLTIDATQTITLTNTLCNTTDTITFTVLNPPVAAITSNSGNTICSGGSLNLSALSGPPVPPGTYSYLWSNGSTSPVISVSAVGCYTVTVTGTGSGCSATSTPFCVTIGQGIPTPTITGTNTICGNSATTLTSSDAGVGATYLWSTGATTASIDANTVGCYTVTASLNGCSATSSELCVTQTAAPTVTAAGATTFCEGGSVILTANSGADSYSWSGGLGSTQSVTATASGNYTVTATNGNCILTSAPISVTVNPVVIPVITASAQTVCSGSSVTLSTANSANNVNYTWSNNQSGANLSSIQVTQAGVYTVTVTTNGGCSATSASITINSGSSFQPSLTVGGNTIICQDQSVILLSNSNTDNQWNLNGVAIQGANSPSYSATATGNYSVTVSVNGCTGTSANVPVVVNLSPVALGSATTDVNGLVQFTNNSTNFFATQWNFGDGTAFSNSTNPSHLYTENGVYQVSLTVYNDCGSNTVTFNVEVLQTSIKALNNDQSLSIAPNPTKDQILVDFNDANTKSLNINMVNLAGQVIYSEIINNFNGKFKQNISLGNFASGVYFIQMVTDSRVITRKVIKD
jgi:hypothetical protein